jgi:hypothetical protein
MTADGKNPFFNVIDEAVPNPDGENGMYIPLESAPDNPDVHSQLPKNNLQIRFQLQPFPAISLKHLHRQLCQARFSSDHR